MEKILEKLKNEKDSDEKKKIRLELYNLIKESKTIRAKLHKLSLEEAEKKLKSKLDTDNHIIDIIKTINVLTKTKSFVFKRLKEISHHFYPKLAKSELEVDDFIKELKKNLNSKEVEEAGAVLDAVAKDLMLELIKHIDENENVSNKLSEKLKVIMEEYCPSLSKIATPLIGAQLIEHGGSLRRLALWPASTIQLLGAEKALFKHLVFKSKSPKYGVIYQHPDVQKAAEKERGKVARKLADKIIIAVRVDYFRRV